MNNRQQFFVHVQLSNGETVVAGYHEVDTNHQLGSFIYGRSYCENPLAFPLDPINLPLKYEQRFYCPVTRFSPTGIHGALLDCGPDEWGKRLLNQFHEPKPISAADYLVMGSGHGVGALQYSDSPTLETEPTANNHKPLNDLYYGAQTFDSEHRALDDLQPLLMPSSGIGGARPKAHVHHNNKSYIAKFNRRDDPFDNALAEYCMMQIAKQAGINCAEVSLVSTDHGNALLVERFDFVEGTPSCRRHLLSANSLLNIQEITELNDVSYDRIAAVGKQLSNTNEIAEEVFTRMLFNIAIGNTDDHTRNHAFLKHPTEGHYQLSPAYDLVPLPQRLGSHAINIGPFGQTPTLDNIKSSGKLMGLDKTKQQVCAQQVYQAVENIEQGLMDLGMTDTDVNYLKPCFGRRNLLTGV